LFDESWEDKLTVCTNNSSLRRKRTPADHWAPLGFKTTSSSGTGKRKSTGKRMNASEKAVKILKTVNIPKIKKDAIDSNKIFNKSLDDFVKNSVNTIYNTGIEQIHILKYLQEKLSEEMAKPENQIQTKK
jgi:hypothetical protein